MEIKTAPEITEIDALQKKVREYYPGMTNDMLFDWLTTPSEERDTFLKEHTLEDYAFRKTVVVTKITVK